VGQTKWQCTCIGTGHTDG